MVSTRNSQHLQQEKQRQHENSAKLIETEAVKPAKGINIKSPMQPIQTIQSIQPKKPIKPQFEPPIQSQFQSPFNWPIITKFQSTIDQPFQPMQPQFKSIIPRSNEPVFKSPHQIPMKSQFLSQKNPPFMSIVQRPMQSYFQSPIQWQQQATFKSSFPYPIEKPPSFQRPNQPQFLSSMQFKDKPFKPSQLISEQLLTAPSENSYHHQLPNTTPTTDTKNLVGRRRRKIQRQRNVFSNNNLNSKFNGMKMKLTDSPMWNSKKDGNVLEAPFSTSTSVGKTQMIIVSSSRTISSSKDGTRNPSNQQITAHRKEALKRPFDRNAAQNKYDIDYDNRLEDEYEIIMKDS